MITVGGSGRYLTDERDSDRTMHASLHYKITTVNEMLNIMSPDLRSAIVLNALEGVSATHVVTEIGWGAQCVVTATHRHASGDDRAEMEGHFQADFRKMKSAIQVTGRADLKMDSKESGGTKSFRVTVYGDVLADDGLIPTDFESAYKFIGNVSKYVKTANSGKGKPLVYELLPLGVLARV